MTHEKLRIHIEKVLMTHDIVLMAYKNMRNYFDYNIRFIDYLRKKIFLKQELQALYFKLPFLFYSS